LGLDHLRRADLPTVPLRQTRPSHQPSPQPPPPRNTPPHEPPPPHDPPPTIDDAPVHLLRRRVTQAVSGGRRVLAFPGDRAAEAARLRRYGLGTAGELLAELHTTAADRARDPFGRLLPADTGRFVRAWLGAAVYTESLDRALCAAAWGADPATDPTADLTMDPSADLTADPTAELTADPTGPDDPAPRPAVRLWAQRHHPHDPPAERRGSP
ncbi:hypothetical protein ACFTXB_13105, partial [Streptomyces sp. NPDC057074]